MSKAPTTSPPPSRSVRGRIRLLSAAAILACLIGCTAPADVDEYPQGILVVGTVRDAGVAVAGVRVRIWGFVPPCRAPTLPATPLLTGSDGRFRYQELSPHAPGTVFCGVARVQFQRAGQEDSITVSGFSIRVAGLSSTNAPRDSTVVDVDLAM